MRKKILRAYITVFFSILLILSFSRDNSDKFRLQVMGWVGTVLNMIDPLKNFLHHPFQDDAQLVRLEELYQENALLKSFKEKHRGYDTPEVDKGVVANVVYRSLDTWSRSLWVNVGSSSKSAEGGSLIAKNSPVLYQGKVIGIVDAVGESMSRIMLVTNPRLAISVRVARGSLHEALLSTSIDQVHRELVHIHCPKELKESTEKALMEIKKYVDITGRVFLMGKGELVGVTQLYGGKRGTLLRGTGFNYDFEDSEGPARDLLTGRVVNHPEIPPTPVVEMGDLLVTTGLDGLFPPGLLVARVISLMPLDGGEYYRDLEAELLVSIDAIDRVSILPPVMDHLFYD